MSLGDCVTLSEDCIGNCTGTSGPCDEPHLAVLECFSQALDASCNGPYPNCFDQLFAYLDCRNVSSPSADCVSSPSFCACSVDFPGGKVYDSECEGDLCDCFANGDYVGTCLQDPQATQICEPLLSCCDAMWAIAAPS